MFLGHYELWIIIWLVESLEIKTLTNWFKTVIIKQTDNLFLIGGKYE